MRLVIFLALWLLPLVVHAQELPQRTTDMRTVAWFRYNGQLMTNEMRNLGGRRTTPAILPDGGYISVPVINGWIPAIDFWYVDGERRLILEYGGHMPVNGDYTRGPWGIIYENAHDAIKRKQQIAQARVEQPKTGLGLGLGFGPLPGPVPEFEYEEMPDMR